MVKSWKPSSWIQEEDKDAHSCHCYIYIYIYIWSLLFNIVLEALSIAIRQEKEIKYMQIERGERKLSHLQMTWYSILRTLKFPSKTIRINEFSKFSGSKINIQKVIAFLYPSEISERESKKNYPVQNLVKKKKKNPRNNLNQGGERPIHWEP